ncbi:MAG: HPr kinase/phosphorylase [Clostridia bacterium]|nr:HPr kinase/phosphorylase [Clostridia bacterium]
MIDKQEFIKAFGFEVLSDNEADDLAIENSDINRPGIQLAGFWDFFAYERPQLLGKVELEYLKQLDPAVKEQRIAKLISYDIPCIIICHRIPCDEMLLRMAREKEIPVYMSRKDTTMVEMEMITWLSDQLAPRVTRHGVLVDVYGVGMMIAGESGVGKSEAALELIKRGHRLVADDVVDIRRVSDTLIGEAPPMIRHLMEIRGVGIIDIATIYGIGAVITSRTIDMVVHLEHWKKDKEYDRLGMDDEHTDILGISIPKLTIPIQPGRNIAIVLEVAARNLRLKQQGYNAAAILSERFNERLKKL